MMLHKLDNGHCWQCAITLFRMERLKGRWLYLLSSFYTSDIASRPAANHASLMLLSGNSYSTAFLAESRDAPTEAAEQFTVAPLTRPCR